MSSIGLSCSPSWSGEQLDPIFSSGSATQISLSLPTDGLAASIDQLCFTKYLTEGQVYIACRAAGTGGDHGAEVVSAVRLGLAARVGRGVARDRGGPCDRGVVVLGGRPPFALGQRHADRLLA